MSLLNNLIYFNKKASISPKKHITTIGMTCKWESFYRNRWKFDKLVRSTHGLTCTGSHLSSWDQSLMLSLQCQPSEIPDNDLNTNRPKE